MTKLRPAANADPAGWLLKADVDWSDVVRYGPPGFDVYVRIAFAGGTERDGEEPALRTALATLMDHTSTPAIGYAAIWEGWTSREPAPMAPRVAIPHRAMLLFTGRVDELGDAPALAWYGSADGVSAEPHLVWPEDQAWCLACEVDEEIEFTVGVLSTQPKLCPSLSPGQFAACGTASLRLRTASSASVAQDDQPTCGISGRLVGRGLDADTPTADHATCPRTPGL